jgi:hypothetical protein
LELYNLRQNGTCVDLVFSVSCGGGDPVKVPVHKNVLIASSSIFASMMNERWSPGDEINIPEKISVDAVELFVKVGGFFVFPLKTVKYFFVSYFSLCILVSLMKKLTRICCYK